MSNKGIINILSKYLVIDGYSINKSIDLDNKVNEFIDWCYENMLNEYYGGRFEKCDPRKIKDFIEKIAVWYELRYPDYIINGMPISKPDSYIEPLTIDEDTINLRKKKNVFNKDAFMNSLSLREKTYLLEQREEYIVYFDRNNSGAHLHLSEYGIVRDAELVDGFTDFEVTDKELIGLHLQDVINLFENRGIKYPGIKEFKFLSNSFNKKKQAREGILNCAMYRIIERGGVGIGPRRAFLFAKEFNRNIDIPMMYGVDSRDIDLNAFIDEYIKSGGSLDLKCYVDYFTSKDKGKTVVLKYIMKKNEKTV